MEIVTNSKGEKRAYVDGKWVPVVSNSAGDIKVFTDGEWIDPNAEKPFLSKGLNPNDPRSYVAETISNIPGDIAEVGYGLASMVDNPKETWEGIKTAVTNPKETGMAIVDSAKENLWPPSKAVRTMAENPFDTATLFSGLPGMKVVEPLAAMGKGAQKAIGGLPQSLYKRAAEIPPSLLDEGTRIAEGGLKRGIPVSKSGAEQVVARRKQIGNQIQKIIDDAESKGVEIPKSTVMKYANDLAESTLEGAEPSEFWKVAQMMETFENQFGGKPTITPAELQKWKVNIYDRAYKRESVPGKEQAINVKTKYQRESGRGAKEAMNKSMPSLSPLNDEFADISKIKPFIDKRIDELAKQDPGLTKLVEMTIARPDALSHIAIALNRIQTGKFDSKTMNWMNQNLNTHEIRTVMALIGASKAPEEE